MLDGESWIFYKTMLSEKHINRPRPSVASHCQYPCSATKYTSVKQKTSAIPIAVFRMFLIFTFVPCSIVK